MKGTDHFKELIKNYLDNRAKEDELFRAKYETTTRTIDDVVNYIFHAVQQSGCCGFSDMEVFAMAVHAIDEPDLEIGKPMDCNVVVNHHIELTEEEKAEQPLPTFRSAVRYNSHCLFKTVVCCSSSRGDNSAHRCKCP